MSRREDVDNSIWADPDFLELSSDAKLLYFWSFTNPHCNMAGLYKVGRAVMALESALSPRRLETALTELADRGFVFYDSGVIWVRTRVKHLRSRNPNMAKSIAGDVDRLEHPFRDRFLQMYRDLPWLRDVLGELPSVEPKAGTVAEPSANGSETVSKRSLAGQGQG